jgi:hypothetical protein
MIRCNDKDVGGLTDEGDSLGDASDADGVVAHSSDHPLHMHIAGFVPNGYEGETPSTVSL